MKNLPIVVFFLILTCFVNAQVKEIDPPFNIKTIAFSVNQENVVPIFKLNEAFTFQFDDLFGSEEDYFYVITHHNYDWKESDLSKNEYLQGFDDLRIRNYSNSINTLQNYSHYEITFPNDQASFKVSGNYMISVKNDAGEVIFSRKFVIYEDLVGVPTQVKRSRTVSNINEMHNLDFTIKAGEFNLQNPLQNVKVMLLQNGVFNTAITNIKPQYTIANDLIYKYDKETQFWAGNEYLYFETKDVRVTNLAVSRVTSGEIYNTYLFTNQSRANQSYTYFPDINGKFVVLNSNSSKPEVEADYTWVYFSLDAPAYFGKSDIYVTGLFNNHALTDEYKLEFNPETKVFEKPILIKQGFTNYKYTLANKKGIIDQENAIDGNFYQTENDYYVLVYYKANNERFDRIIGRGMANSVNISN